MSELKDDLDRALRSVTFGAAPVDRAMRDGHRLRNRRRLTVLAGAVAIVAVAAGYPALTRNAASTSPTPATGPTHTASPTATPHRDPVITSRLPTDVANTGAIARGTIGGAQWSVTISADASAREQACYAAFVGAGSTGLAARSAGQVLQSCAPSVGDLASFSAPDPAGFTAGIGTETGGTATYVAALGAVAPDVTYLTLDFADGQQLKLVPVSYLGHRFVAWLAPASMTVTRLTAHLGTAHADTGQIQTAVPYQAPGHLPVFSLWLKPGQSVPPRASGVISGGTKNGQVWSVTADEGPWGTCFAYSWGGSNCVSSAWLGSTQIVATLSWGAASDTVATGSAAPGVKKVVITLSNHKTVVLTPVTVGNERLFAYRYGKGVSPVRWDAFDANGHNIGHGSMSH